VNIIVASLKMKNKNLLFTVTFLIFFLSLIISSCRNTSNVVSSGLIQKRKYNKGYFVKVLSVKSTNSKLEAKDNDEMAVNSSPNTLSNKAKLEINTETKLEERNNNSLVLLAMNNVILQRVL